MKLITPIRKILSTISLITLCVLGISLLGVFVISYFAAQEQPFNPSTELWQISNYMMAVCGWSNLFFFFLVVVDLILKHFEPKVHLFDTDSKYTHILDYPMQKSN